LGLCQEHRTLGKAIESGSESASIADWQANTTDAGQVLASRLFGSQAPVDCCGGGEIMLQAWLD
jgi:hypothetical protein